MSETVHLPPIADAGYPHIMLDRDSRAWICGHNTKVAEIVMDHVGYGWTAEEIHFQHPHLPLSHIHSALAYYYDHRPMLDAEISSQLEKVEALRKEVRSPRLLQKLPVATA